MSLRLDSYYPADTVLHRLDPRARLLFTFAATLALGAAPAEPWLLAGALACALVLARLSDAPAASFLARTSAVSPFILLMAALRLLTGVEETVSGLAVQPAAVRAAIALVLKGYTAILLLGVLVVTSGIPQILWALEKLHAPQVLVMTANLMFRYFDLLLDEYGNLVRARSSRCSGPLSIARIPMLASEIGLLFIKSWERAERVHAAMVSRGFTGSLPPGQTVDRTKR
ncbi:MAG: cobalt ECF transporter T component CbiQ [Acidobacteria bacterium]|nr:cobalt ECF transporter T component CbiQ [Acidobacteriota bacterium]